MVWISLQSGCPVYCTCLYVSSYKLCIMIVQWVVNYYSVEINNKMQPCNRIYYSTVHWRLNTFRAAVVKSEWEFPLRLDYGRSPHEYVNQRLQIQLELLMTSGMPLETCWAFNERWNNKFYYKVASCWLFLQSHTTMHGSTNIKFKNGLCWYPWHCLHFAFQKQFWRFYMEFWGSQPPILALM
jgi:hypothetical protein